jgi:hypothetical protein
MKFPFRQAIDLVSKSSTGISYDSQRAAVEGGAVIKAA